MSNENSAIEFLKRIKSNIYQGIDFYFKYPKISKKFDFEVLSNKATLQKLLSEKCSVSRFGDGEIVLMNMESIGFQEADTYLRDRLKEIIASEEQGIMICLTDCMLTTDEMRREPAMYCRSWTVKHQKLIEEIVPHKRLYGCTNFTRFYADLANKEYSFMQSKVDMIKRIWDGSNVYLIEGEYTRCGIGNDLLDNALSVHRIICPATNAFFKYSEILETACKYIPLAENVLVLCLLGPTATVLSYDLFKKGYRAIDMGHVDIEYEWFKRGTEWKEKLDCKAVNERGGNCPENPIYSDEYKKQIICKVL